MVMSGSLFEQVRQKLTQREGQVLALIVLGKCNKEIASELGISLPTAKFHAANLLHKFNVNTRIELLSLLVRTERG